MFYCGMIRIQITNMEDAVMSEEIKELNNKELNEVAGGTDTDVCNKCGQPDSKHVNSFLNYGKSFLHRVVGGDTLANIAPRYKTTIAQLQRWNNIHDPAKIYVGQLLVVCVV